MIAKIKIIARGRFRVHGNAATNWGKRSVGICKIARRIAIHPVSLLPTLCHFCMDESRTITSNYRAERRQEPLEAFTVSSRELQSTVIRTAERFIISQRCINLSRVYGCQLSRISQDQNRPGQSVGILGAFRLPPGYFLSTAQ